MTRIKLLLLTLVFSLTGCANMNIHDYQNETPKLDLFTFFEGKTHAWGQFQDRSGKVIKRFQVDITGVVSGNKLILDEQFLYSDGTHEERIWTINRSAANQYIGTAKDVVGEAQGISSGNALNWRYTLDLPYGDGSIHVKFDDWMFLHTDNTMINRAEVTKFGFKVGEVTLFFSKQQVASL